MDNESNDLDDDDDNKHRAGKNVVAALKKSQFARKKKLIWAYSCMFAFCGNRN